MKPLLHLVGILFPHINDDARSKSHQIGILQFNIDSSRQAEHPHPTPMIRMGEVLLPPLYHIRVT